MYVAVDQSRADIILAAVDELVATLLRCLNVGLARVLNAFNEAANKCDYGVLADGTVHDVNDIRIDEGK